MAGPSGPRVNGSESNNQPQNGSVPRQDTDLDKSNPPAYFAKNYHVAEIPPFRRDPPPSQEHPDYPFNLPSGIDAHFKFHANSDDEDVILPIGARPEKPLYTLRFGNERTLSKKYTLKLFRNNERKPGWFDAEKPLSITRIHTHFSYLDFEFNRSDGKKISFNGFTNPTMFEYQKGKAFPWPMAADEPGRYMWTFPTGSSEKAKPWIFARLCRMKDKKTIDHESHLADVSIWREATQLYDDRTYIKIPMHEILSVGKDRESQLQQIDDILTVAVAFAAGLLRFSYERRRGGGGGGSDSSGSIAVAASTSAACC